MRFFFLILSFCTVLSGCVSDSKIETPKEEIKIGNTLFSIDLSTFNLDSLESLPKIDSLSHIQIINDFPGINLNKEYSHYEPLREYRSVKLFENVSSKLILRPHEAWGNQVFVLNYSETEVPISAYELVSCGGDGGYYYCSKAKIEGMNCVITSESGEPLGEDDYTKVVKTIVEKTYFFDSKFKLIIQDSTSHKDTL